MENQELAELETAVVRMLTHGISFEDVTTLVNEARRVGYACHETEDRTAYRLWLPTTSADTETFHFEII